MNIAKRAKSREQATHADESGYLYKVLGEEPKEFCVNYWDLRLRCWCQDMGKTYPYLIKIENK